MQISRASYLIQTALLLKSPILPEPSNNNNLPEPDLTALQERTLTNKEEMFPPITSGLQFFDQPSVPTLEYHKPPPSEESSSSSDSSDSSDNINLTSYNNNPTIFGRILDGSSPSRPIIETNNVYVFHDKFPRAPLHALVIPKKFIPSIQSLRPNDNTDIQLLNEMKLVALQTIQTLQPKAYREKDYILCFHSPPFNSVSHLHLHVLAPASDMAFQHRNVKYLVGTRWCIDVDAAISRLEVK